MEHFPIKNKIVLVVISIVIIIAIFTLGAVFLKKSDLNLPTVTVTQGNLVEKILAVGNIIPKHSITVTSSIPGIVGTLFHDKGDFVKKGDVLMEVNPNPTPKDLATARRNLEQKQESEQKANTKLKRMKELQAKDYVSQDEYDQAEEKARTAISQRRLAEEQLNLLDKGKAGASGHAINSLIISPMTGYVLDRLVDEGDPVVPQTDYQTGNVLFEIGNIDDLNFEGEINEIDRSKISTGMPAEVTLAAHPDQIIKGVLTKIDLKATSSAEKSNVLYNKLRNNINSPFSVGFKVSITQLKLPPKLILHAGYSANAEIIIKNLSNVLLLPERVIKMDNDRPYVLLTNEQGDAPIKQFIEAGASDGINTEIVKGLKKGEKVLDISSESSSPPE